jgi:hypothetical protein
VSNQHYRQRLVELERTLSVRIKSAVADGGQQVADSARDAASAPSWRTALTDLSTEPLKRKGAS